MANVAVINGSSRGLGLAFSRFLLQKTNLQVVATTSRETKNASDAILSDLDDGSGVQDRLTCVELDVLKEDSIEKAAKTVQDKFGKGNLRLLINVAGMLAPEKTITKLNYDNLLKSFQINTFGHMLTFKHFVPLVPSRNAKLDYSDDPSNGLLSSHLSILASMTARIGSIGDNNAVGGWYSYRASKAATNQVIKTLDLELRRRAGATAASATGSASESDTANSAIAVALHPGTLLGTDLSKPFVNPKGQDGKKAQKGVHTPEEGAEMLLNVLKGLDKDSGGSYLDYAGKSIPW